jgi:beta-N-acetylhexosaminidase
VRAGKLIAVVLAASFAGCGGDDEPRPLAQSAPPEATTTQGPATTEGPPTTEAPPPDERDSVERLRLSLPEALGQTIVARYTGPRPSRSLLARIRRGQVGGVILFADNVQQSRAGIRAAIRGLDRAARAGRRPKPLVMVDQEGGLVKRLPGPPSSPARSMRDPLGQGVATGRMLRGLGIDVDLAPVADVAHDGSFIGSRAFGTTPRAVARRACAFARGLLRQGVAPALKHFPGLGYARVNTDEAQANVVVEQHALDLDLEPYRRCGMEPGTLVMLSSAVYPYLGREPAVLDRNTYRGRLPRDRSWPVTISDALETPALANEPTPARRALVAGLDMLLYANTEQGSARAYEILLRDARAGRIPRHRIDDAAKSVLQLKAFLAG